MSNDEIVLDSSIDQLISGTATGSIRRAIFNNLYGINAKGTGNAVPREKLSPGFTFFTRPQLNLTTFNISNYRGFYNLLTEVETSYQRFTRNTLDPRLAYNGLRCPLVDKTNAFIPFLSNNLTSMSGFPDLTAPTYSSESGLYGEEMSFVDGVTNHYESYDIDATFKNLKGSPLLYFFYTWVKYQTLVFEGILNPYLDMVTENEIDYNTRIYRITLDQQRRYITYMGCTGASFPISVPTGSVFDYSTDKPFNGSTADFNIRFRCMGFTPFEDLVKYKFNQTQAIFNPDIRKLLEYDMSGPYDSTRLREEPDRAYEIPGCNYIKVPHYLISKLDSTLTDNQHYNLNHRSIPYCNLATGELEWFCDKSLFKPR